MFEGFETGHVTAWFHRFLMRRPEPFPETMIGANVEFYMRHLMESWSTVPDSFTGEAFVEYLRCFAQEETIHASCEDYRAITLDLKHHAADRDTHPGLVDERRGPVDGMARAV
jgi:haloacetate dehalogenase